MDMELVFEWDSSKARMNLQKHKVTFEEARTLFSDPLLLTYRDEPHSETEERYISIGHSARNRLLVVVHTERTETEDILTIRIISCRKATASERRAYEESNE
jgi:uncharacterized DUF497 family protein